MAASAEVKGRMCCFLLSLAHLAKLTVKASRHNHIHGFSCSLMIEPASAAFPVFITLHPSLTRCFSSYSPSFLDCLKETCECTSFHSTQRGTQQSPFLRIGHLGGVNCVNTTRRHAPISLLINAGCQYARDGHKVMNGEGSEGRMVILRAHEGEMTRFG
jgi:hypothetical protein